MKIDDKLLPIKELIHLIQTEMNSNKPSKYTNELLSQTISITNIPAPPFREQIRGEYIKNQFETIGYTVEIDKVGNVIAYKGDMENAIILSAHLDTVFETTDISVKQKNWILTGPGVGDDSRGLAVLLFIAKYLYTIETNYPIVYIATVGEEGVGDLRGAKYIFRENSIFHSCKAFITIDGVNTSRVVDAGIGSLRYKLEFIGPGGHSYGAFGKVNPAYALGHFLHEFSMITVPSHPKTTHNVGVIKGGTSINSIPASIQTLIDIRSESEVELQKLNQIMINLIKKSTELENKSRSDKIKYNLTCIGNRPVGYLQNNKIRQILHDIHLYLKIPLSFEASSTDANIPLSMGIPALSVASVHEGGQAHTLNEWINADQKSLLPVLRNIILIYVLSNYYDDIKID